MTDRERWMTTDDPAWMLSVLGDEADERRLLIAMRAVQSYWDAKTSPHQWDLRSGIEAKNWLEIISIIDDKFVPAFACGAIRCLWPSPFFERERDICEQCEGKKTVETIARHYGWSEKRRGESYEDGECWECRGKGSIPIPLINPRWRTPTVMDLAKQVMGAERRETRRNGDFMATIEAPNPDLSPILSDALMDAGCEVPEIIEHLKCGVHVAGECWVIGGLLGEAR